jgi:hypothetical protein
VKAQNSKRQEITQLVKDMDKPRFIQPGWKKYSPGRNACSRWGRVIAGISVVKQQIYEV